MIKRKIGQSDIKVTPLTLGCMSLGTDERVARRMIDYALDQGINHLDTADLYDFGRNEEIVGNAIKHRRSNLIITSKVGNHFNSATKKWFWDPSKKYIEQAVKNSLQRLQTDYIDLYLLHGGTIDDPFDETIEAFEQLKQAGYIRAYGISSIRPNVINKFATESSIDAVMMQYSMLDRRPEQVLNILQDKNISLLARGPLAKGILTDMSSIYIRNKDEDGYLTYKKQELIKTIEKISNISNKSLCETAIRYVLTHPTTASAVFGASSLEQLKQNINISPTNLELSLYNYIKSITKQSKYTQHLHEQK